MGAAPEVPIAFEREQGFTDSEWRRCLRGAVGPHTLALPAPGQAVVTLLDGLGTMHLRWTVLPPRRIALLCMPRLAVRYRFDGVPAEARRAFMRFFDLYTQRGGG
ncbi:MAG: hypothetical protein Q7U73_15030 [Rubrivivax sp.]|nr:hypothetical protein [Rubrivivax sp.]